MKSISVSKVENGFVLYEEGATQARMWCSTEAGLAEVFAHAVKVVFGELSPAKLTKGSAEILCENNVLRFSQDRATTVDKTPTPRGAL